GASAWRGHGEGHGTGPPAGPSPGRSGTTLRTAWPDAAACHRLRPPRHRRIPSVSPAGPAGRPGRLAVAPGRAEGTLAGPRADGAGPRPQGWLPLDPTARPGPRPGSAQGAG